MARGEVTATVDGQDHTLLTVKVPRGTGIGVGAELDISIAGSHQSFPVMNGGGERKRVINTTQGLEERTQVFKG